MSNKFTFNPIEGRFDIVDDEVHEVASPSSTSNDDIEKVTGGIVYFWVDGHRYKLTGTLDDPTGTGGTPMGLLLSLTYAT